MLRSLSNEHLQMYERIWDDADYVIPPSENNAFFVMTNVIVTPNQTRTHCPEDHLEIHFQNENLIAYRNGRAVCTVPDLITLVEVENGEPIGTEMLRYGLRVAVIGMPAPVELKTPEYKRLYILCQR